MELLKTIFSPRYREIVRLREELRIQKMVHGKDSAKPVTLVVDDHFGRRRTYSGVHLVGQDGRNLDVEGKNVWVTSTRSAWDLETRRRHNFTGIEIFSGRKKIPFRTVVDIQ